MPLASLPSQRALSTPVCSFWREPNANTKSRRNKVYENVLLYIECLCSLPFSLTGWAGEKKSVGRWINGGRESTANWGKRSVGRAEHA